MQKATHHKKKLGGYPATGVVISITLLAICTMAAFVGSAVIRSEAPIGAVAERVKVETDMLIMTTSRAISDDEGPSASVAPLVYFDFHNWATGLSVWNAEPDPLTVEIEMMEIWMTEDVTATAFYEEITIPPKGMGFIHEPGTSSESGGLRGAIITGTGQHIVEVDQVKYDDGSADAGNAMSYRTIPFADLATDGDRLAQPLFQKGDPETGLGDTSGVQVFNPTDQPVQFTYTFFDDDGVLQIGVLEPISLAPKTGMTFYSMDIEELPAGFSGSMIIDVVGDSGGLVSVLNNVNYAVDGDGSTAYTPVTFSLPVAIEDPGPPAPPVIPYYGQ
jgi:hypothetical protein